MKKIIPFLFIGCILLCLWFFLRPKPAASGVVTDEYTVQDGDTETIELATSTNASTTEVGVFWAATSTGTTTTSSLLSVPKAVISATTSAVTLVRVEPGYGGGGASVVSPVVEVIRNLPAYEEDKGKTDPVIEFEYCD